MCSGTLFDYAAYIVMQIQSLSVLNFRNLSTLKLEQLNEFTAIVGPNGSGKTSFLESIYYLSRGRSLRTHLSHQMIEHHADALCIHATLSDSDGAQYTIGIERRVTGQVRLRRNGEVCDSFSEITALLPVLLIDTDSHRVFASGPKERRARLDWGGFYHFNDFAQCWRHYKRALIQRNSALKAKQQDVMHWDALLVESGLKLDQYRKQYLKRLEAVFRPIWANIAKGLPCVEFQYVQGWDVSDSFDQALKLSRLGDQSVGFTRVGPHRADVLCEVDGHSAFHVLSQGQQKLMAYALSLAQGALLQTDRQIESIYLVDDLTAELDRQRSSDVISTLVESGMQVFLTCIQPEVINESFATVFHPKVVDLSEYLGCVST
ncbi:MAG: DNA replication/repair protein RecF [Legionellales bacterium]|nr:DNA replication/repair protein RecF [Legionellales bacterium]